MNTYIKILNSLNPDQLQFKTIWLGILIFFAALLGIAAQSEGLLSIFWPANALLVAIFIRYPKTHCLISWIYVFIGFVAADLLLGNSLLVTIILTLANCIFAATFLVLFTKFLPTSLQRLETPQAILYLLFIDLIAVSISSACAMLAYPLAPTMFGHNLTVGFWSWFSAGLINSLLVLPVILLMPSWQQIRYMFQDRRHETSAQPKKYKTFSHYLPIISLGLSPIMASLIGGPGTLVFHLPALLWCALNYQLFTTALLTLLMSIWLIFAFHFNFVPLFPSHLSSKELINWAISIRISIALLTLIPLMIATSHQVQKKLLFQLKESNKYDHLTTALSRSAFYQITEQLIETYKNKQTSFSLCMLDLDFFKNVNDQYGHITGDQVLREFAYLVQSQIRQQDIFARVGGEEFVLVTSGHQFPNMFTIIDRVRQHITDTPILLDDGHAIHITVSIGVIHIDQLQPAHTLKTLLDHADKALYEAKKAGRNQVVCMSL